MKLIAEVNLKWQTKSIQEKEDPSGKWTHKMEEEGQEVEIVATQEEGEAIGFTKLGWIAL